MKIPSLKGTNQSISVKKQGFNVKQVNLLCFVYGIFRFDVVNLVQPG